MPQACAKANIFEANAATAFKKGCLIHGATNYDHTAKQSGVCTYRGLGCTSPTALNFNSEAAVSDGSCIEPTYGCTLDVDPYAGVLADTPGYRNRFVGVPPVNNVNASHPEGGRIDAPLYRSVVQHDPNANTLANCTIAIEGCMDVTAVNYNSQATINTRNWCVPSLEGCMIPVQLPTLAMPPLAAERSVAANMAGWARDRGGAANFAPLATVSKPSTCVASRLGCADSLAANYDSYATMDDGSCLPMHPGCLDVSALNFNCTARGVEACNADVPRPTYHDASACVFFPFPQPPPPSPPLPSCWNW